MFQGEKMDNERIDLKPSKAMKDRYILTIGHLRSWVTREMLDEIVFKKQVVLGELPEPEDYIKSPTIKAGQGE
jgi:hypothetical protein